MISQYYCTVLQYLQYYCTVLQYLVGPAIILQYLMGPAIEILQLIAIGNCNNIVTSTDEVHSALC